MRRTIAITACCAAAVLIGGMLRAAPDDAIRAPGGEPAPTTALKTVTWRRHTLEVPRGWRPVATPDDYGVWAAADGQQAVSVGSVTASGDLQRAARTVAESLPAVGAAPTVSRRSPDDVSIRVETQDDAGAARVIQRWQRSDDGTEDIIATWVDRRGGWPIARPVTVHG